jgi:hypothetical protein
MIDRRSLLVSAAVAGIASRAGAQTPPPAVAGGALVAGLPEPNETIDLWPKGAPGMPARPPIETVVDRDKDGTLADRAVVGTTRPRLVVFRPRIPNGSAVLGHAWRRLCARGDRQGGV